MFGKTVLLLFSGPKPTSSHALLDFADEGTAIVPSSKLVEGSLSEGRCRVKWHDGKEYECELAFTGKHSNDSFYKHDAGWFWLRENTDCHILVHVCILKPPTCLSD